jgi:CDP-glycerol glycerophosphotransferase (TagB/SpsB family)
MSKLISIFQNIFRILSSVLTPYKVIVFCSYPVFTDNAFAIYQHIIHNNLFTGYKLVWIVLNSKEIKKDSLPHGKRKTDVIILSKKSPVALFYYLIAKYVFFTHGLYSNLKIARQNTVINLWHGMPLKRIGLMDNQGSSYMGNSQILIATSELFQKLMAQSFGKPVTNVLIIGQPRNDMMSQPTDFYDSFNINKSSYSSIGIWLPTYRATTIGEIRIDGNFDKGKISFLDLEQLLELNAFLEQNKILLIIKLHPMDKLQEYNFNLFTNLKIVKQKDFTSQLYPLLGSTDFLLTDYSSVWVDYDILGKPMGFVIDDIEEYKKSRGFTIDNLDRELPGKIIRNMDALKVFLLNQEKYKVYTGERFNKFKDDNASERLLNWLAAN